jgi:hypothetical protein
VGAVRLALLALVLGACTADAVVLDDPKGVVVTCDQAWQAPPGQPCALAGPCDRDSPFDPTCCTDYAYCAMGTLVVDTACAPSCGCADDRACTYGAQICDADVCIACPSIAACATCPVGWVPLQRNGCPTCACAPPPACDVPGDVCPAAPDEVCYAGASCADKCDASTPGCCSNICAAPGCQGPAPVGCFTDCPPELGCDRVCATAACKCDGAGWTCDAVCVDQVTVSCVYP